MRHSFVMKNPICLTSIILLICCHLYAEEDWTQDGPFGSNSCLLEVAAWDSGLIFMGTAENGIYRADTSDWIWTKCNYGLPEMWDLDYLVFDEEGNPNYAWDGNYSKITQILTQSEDENVVWLTWNLHNLVFKSENAGDSWQQVELPLEENYQVTSVHLMNEPGEVLVCCYHVVRYSGMIYRSDDSGESWEILCENNPPPTFVQIPGEADHLINGTFESFDGGANWNIRDQGGHSYRPIVLDPSNYDRLYGFGLNEFWWWQLVKTNDQGESWFSLDTIDYAMPDLPLLYVCPLGHVFINDRNYYCNISYNYGASFIRIPWAQREDFFDVTLVDDIKALDSESERLLFATSAGAVVAYNELSSIEWKIDGLNDCRIQDIQADPELPGSFFAAGPSGLFKTTNAGNSWLMKDSRYYKKLLVNSNNPESVIALNNSELVASNNGGIDWEIKIDLADTYRDEIFYKAIDMANNPEDEEEIFLVFIRTYHLEHAYNFVLLRSEDGGVSFEIILDTDQNLPYQNYYPIEVDARRPNRIYLTALNDIHYSSDHGSTWASHPLPDSIKPIDLLAGYSDSLTVYMTTLDNLFRSEDGGETWEVEDLGFEIIKPHSLRSLRSGIENDEAMYLVVAGQGIYYREDFANRWELVEGPYDGRVTSIAEDSEGRIAVGTHGQGVWVYGEPLIVEEIINSSSQPSTHTLLDGYPNPFNNYINITFSMSYTSQLRLDIININGQVVTELADEYITSGNHNIVWDGTDCNRNKLSSGIYFIRMQTEVSVKLKKIVLLK
ncbi:MAG: T9SS type A sorting domain-containing protein [Candidatus Electryonea clarkiae]|nr:T9SS type A sorting domain-containing protein [Candidatus Electryonea clarkiae]MDP8285896.1 T9SS type A sorting domain-containing protein [Candidatus Electryonea clarkiae]